MGLGEKATERLPRDLGETDLNAQRRPDLDDEYLVGWELPDETVLQVGHGSARLTVGGERFHLLAWPDRPRVWAARRTIAGLGLPADTGAAFAGTADAAEPVAGTVHSIVESHPSWAVDADGSPVVEQRALAAMPPLDVVEERLVLESEVGAGELLQELRRLEPPPAPPQLRVGVAVERTDFVLHSDGIEEIETRYEIDGSHHARRQAVHRWRPPTEGESGTNELGRAVAAVTAGPVTVIVRSLHRSHLLDVSSPSFRATWFVPGADGLTLASELAWSGFIRDRGLEADGIVSLDSERPPTEESAFASPAGAELIRRRVTRRWVRSADVPGRRRLPPGPDAATEFGLTLDGGAVAEPPTSDVADVAEAMVASAVAATGGGALQPDIVFRERLEVEETWRGAVTTEVEYEVVHGQAAWPPLANGDRVAEFVVDLTGELRLPSEARWAQLEDCDSCGRKMLLGSISCPWCSDLAPVEPNEQRRLPRELLAGGCQLRWVPALTGRPLLIVGTERIELVRLEGPGVDEWISAQGVTADHHRLALGARRQLDVDDDLIVRPGVPAATPANRPEISSEAVVVARVDDIVVTYRVDRSAVDAAQSKGPGDIAGATIPLGAGQGTMRSVVEHLDVADEPIPTPADEIRGGLLVHLADRVRSDQTGAVTLTPPAAVTIDEHLTVVQVIAAPDGLREVRTKGDEVLPGDHQPWRRRGPVVWLEPTVSGGEDDEVIAWAEVAAVETVVISNDQGRFLVVRTDDGQERLPWPAASDPVVLQ